MQSQSYQTEQECGNGSNDWTGAMHAWDLMCQYLNNGVSGYFYWNTSLLDGGVSTWGWSQNSPAGPGPSNFRPDQSIPSYYE